MFGAVLLIERAALFFDRVPIFTFHERGYSSHRDAPLLSIDERKRKGALCRSSTD